MAALIQAADLSEIDAILQTLMFSLYGNQYDSREEFLLLSIFGIVMSEQFQNATDFGSLLRANTPASRLLTTFTRRGSGQAYLKLALHSFIKSLCADPSLDLEINFQLVSLLN
jgi:Ras GTPase-activating-like protein IQGAP2/3